jgi:predicted O-linked N-acetylglucosamine transferase (SPINDLY family)
MAAADKINRAIASFQQGKFEEAERDLKQVLRKEPRHLAALNIMAVVLTTLKKYTEAEKHLKSALAINSASDATFYNYGLVLKALGRPDEALERFSQAIAINPRNADSWNNRGTVLNDLRDSVRAIQDFDRAISLNPNYPGAFCNKGKSLAELERYDEALAAYDRALILKPDLTEAWFGRGFVFHQLHRYDEAATAYAEALRRDPHLPFLKGNLAHERMLTCDWAGIDRLVSEIEHDVAAGKLAAEPFGWQGLATSQQSLQQCAESYNRARFPAISKGPPFSPLGADGKIRVGYLSGEFRQQATSLLLVGVLEHHDSSRFEIHVFDNGWDDGSETRQRVDNAVHRVTSIKGLSDPQAVATIRENKIDILVNLNGYFGKERTRVFARRAAPLQVNYLGFPGTLGADYMDYIVADRHVIPEEHKPLYAEKVVYLPHCYQPNDRKKVISTFAFSRTECGLPDRGFVFCCFNNSYKITPDVFDRWMRILTRVEGSVLWLLEDDPVAAVNLKREAQARGVDAERIVFAGRLPLSEHLARHRCADLFLDTLPYNAHTTASDALWAGLPVLTCLGTTFAGRVAASLLRSISLPDLVTATANEYEDLAVSLATQPDTLAKLKRKLADQQLTTPLFDTALYTKHLEATYAAIAERHNAGLAPDHIVVAG